MYIQVCLTLYFTFISHTYCRFVMYNKPNIFIMEETNELIKALTAKIDSMDSNIKRDLASVNKRLDGIEYELKKLNTVTKYRESYENIPA